MIGQLFLSLTDYPFFRRIIWKPIYEMLAKKFKVKDWCFMNYGYAPFQSESLLELHERDEINRYPIQLYHYLASKVNLDGLEMLEVGSGRGGGAEYIKRYHSPHKMVGMDIAYNAIKLSRDLHQCDGLYFVQGNAEKMPFSDETFDVVINVESSHAYGSVPRFLQEVKRVLKKDGYFLCTDMRSPEGMNTLRNNLIQSGLQLEEEDEISKNVVMAIEQEELVKRERIKKHIPKWFRKAFSEFAGVLGSKIHTDLRDGLLVYHRFILKKI